MRALLSLIAVVCLGCSGKIDGDTDASPDASSVDSPASSDSPAPSGLAGTWVGYVESFKFADGTDAVKLVLDDTGAGTTFFGPGPALTPPTDPDVGYPPGGADAGVDARENFAFTNLSPKFAAPRLTLSVSQGEIYKQWCELQTKIYPVYNGQSDGGCGNLLGYGCLPNVAFEFGQTCSWTSCDQPNSQPVDCNKLDLCKFPSICRCTSTSCTVPPPPSGNIAFDVQLSGNSLDGSVSGLDGQVHNVHFTRQ